MDLDVVGGTKEVFTLKRVYIRGKWPKGKEKIQKSFNLRPGSGRGEVLISLRGGQRGSEEAR